MTARNQDGVCDLLSVRSNVVSVSVVAAAGKRRAAGPSESRCILGLLAAGFFESPALQSDSTHVYSVAEGRVMSVPVRGGTPATLASFEPDTQVAAIALDDSDVYATVSRSAVDGARLHDIVAIAKTGGAPRVLATGIVNPADLAVDATHVYWIAQGTHEPETDTWLTDGELERVKKDGSTRELLAGELSLPNGVELDETFVYFRESGKAVGKTQGGIHRLAKSGGTPARLTDGLNDGGID